MLKRLDFVKVTERGWGGHFICADRCLFRGNTLIEGNNDQVIVSTVGNYHISEEGLQPIGYNRYYETMAFGTKPDGIYTDANVSDERRFESPWSICAESSEELPDDVDNKANEQHETVVAEFTKLLSKPYGVPYAT